MNLKTWVPDTSVTDSTRDCLPRCGKRGLRFKPPGRLMPHASICWRSDEDERGALGTALDFESNLQSEFALS